MSIISTLSRRTLVASAATLPALAVPAAASATPTPAGPTTLPPDLIERFVRVRAWYLDYHRREQAFSDEVDRQFYAATGVTAEQYDEMNYEQRRESGLYEAHSKACNEAQLEERYETECDDMCDERWDVARAMMAQKPRTFADLAYQMEALLVADLEIIQGGEAKDGGDWLVRMLLHHIRALGALPLPADSFDSLRIDVSEPWLDKGEDDSSDEEA